MLGILKVLLIASSAWVELFTQREVLEKTCLLKSNDETLKF
jgi:hypothetical protein